MIVVGMGRLGIFENEDCSREIVQTVGIVLRATPQELKAAASLMLEEVELHRAPLPGGDGANLLAGVSDALDHLRAAVARCESVHGRDVIRSLPDGALLDQLANDEPPPPSTCDTCSDAGVVGEARGTDGSIERIPCPNCTVSFVTDETPPDAAWFAWSGGPRPVGEFTLVEAGTRSGRVVRTSAHRLRWEHVGGDSDVLRYRIVSATRNSIEAVVARLTYEERQAALAARGVGPWHLVVRDENLHGRDWPTPSNFMAITEYGALVGPTGEVYDDTLRGTTTAAGRAACDFALLVQLLIVEADRA